MKHSNQHFNKVHFYWADKSSSILEILKQNVNSCSNSSTFCSPNVILFGGGHWDHVVHGTKLSKFKQENLEIVNYLNNYKLINKNLSVIYANMVSRYEGRNQTIIYSRIRAWVNSISNMMLNANISILDYFHITDPRYELYDGVHIGFQNKKNNRILERDVVHNLFRILQKHKNNSNL